MTVPINTTNRVEYTGDSSTTVFSFAGGRTFFSNDDIKVYLDGVLQTTGYTVAGAGNPAGGTVTFDTAPATNVLIALVRQTSINQLTNYEQVTSFQSQSHEDALDRLTLIAQELDDANNRSLKIPLSETPTDTKTTLPLARAGKVLFFDSEGDVSALTPAEIGVVGELGNGTPNTVFGYGANGVASNFSLSNSFAIASSVISITSLPANIINTAAVADGSITDAKLTTINGGKIIANTLNGDRVQNATLNGSALINGTVTQAKLESAMIARLNDIPEELYSGSVNAQQLIISDLIPANYVSFDVECNNLNVSVLNEIVHLQFGTSASNFFTTGYAGTLSGQSALSNNYEIGSTISLPIARAGVYNDISFRGYLHIESGNKPRAYFEGTGGWITQGGGMLNISSTITALKFSVVNGTIQGNIRIRGYKK